MTKSHYEKMYSDFEVKNTAMKFPEDEIANIIGCVGSMEEAMNVKKIEKKCEGVVTKSVIKGDGTGELKLSLHMRYDLFQKSYGMISDGYKAGVYSYGNKSVHKPFCLTMEVLDEDGIGMLRAYPNCVVSEGRARKIENGAEEVAEIEMTVTVMPDENGQGVYEAVESLITDTTLKEEWLTKFTSILVKQLPEG